MASAKFPTLTPTRVSALACPKRFYDEHVAKRLPPQPFSRPLAYGSAVHAALKNAYDPVGEVPAPDRDVARLARQAVVAQNYPDKTLCDADVARCTATTTAYLSQTGYRDETIAVETMDSVSISAHTKHPLALGAKYDRLLLRSDDPRRGIS